MARPKTRPWCPLAVDYFRNPKVMQAGFYGAMAHLALMLAAKDQSASTSGALPSKCWTASYLLAYLGIVCEQITSDMLADGMDAAVDCGLVDFGEEDGKQVVMPHGWQDYNDTARRQVYREDHKRKPRRSSNVLADCQQSASKSASPPPTPPPKLQTQVHTQGEGERARDDYEIDIEESQEPTANGFETNGEPFRNHSGRSDADPDPTTIDSGDPFEDVPWHNAAHENMVRYVHGRRPDWHPQVVAESCERLVAKYVKRGLPLKAFTESALDYDDDKEPGHRWPKSHGMSALAKWITKDAEEALAKGEINGEPIPEPSNARDETPEEKAYYEEKRKRRCAEDAERLRQIRIARGEDPDGPPRRKARIEDLPAFLANGGKLPPLPKPPPDPDAPLIPDDGDTPWGDDPPQLPPLEEPPWGQEGPL